MRTSACLALCVSVCAAASALASWGDPFDGSGRFATFNPIEFDLTGNATSGSLSFTLQGPTNDRYAQLTHSNAPTADGAAFAMMYSPAILGNQRVRATLNPALANTVRGTPMVAFRYTLTTGRGYFAGVDWGAGQLRLLRRDSRFASMVTVASAAITGFDGTKEYQIRVLSERQRQRVSLVDVVSDSEVASIDNALLINDTGVSGYGVLGASGQTEPIFCTFDDVSANPILRPADVSGDSRSDIVWRNLSNGQVARWAMQSFNSINFKVVETLPDSNWFIKGTGDFDMDGQSDIYWHNILTGEVVVWVMRGDQYYNWAPLPSAPAGWEIGGIADMNGDGIADILWRNPNTGVNGAWIMNGQSIAAWLPLPYLGDAAWRMIGAGDLDRDGDADILWQNTSTGEVANWIMSGSTIVSYNPMGFALGYTLVGLADFDEDEIDLDPVWQEDATGIVGAWVMNGPSTITQWRPFGSVPPTIWRGAN